MALIRVIAVLLLLAVSASAEEAAQKAAPPAAPGAPAAQPAQQAPPAQKAPPSAPAAQPAHTVVPPEPIELPQIPYPKGAKAPKDVIDVEVRIVISTTGEVRDVQLVKGAGEPFDSAVLQGARRFRFKPAIIDGQPTEVMVPFTQHFVAPVQVENAAPVDSGPKRDAVLLGIMQERGTRAYARGMDVVARVNGIDYPTTTDNKGRFRLELPSGDVEVRAGDSDHHPFLQHEHLGPSEQLKVRYLVDRFNANVHESVIQGDRERNEISRTTLSGREIKNIPGTFGDPFRVVTVLPGVTTVMSLLPYPVVRGSSPGDTGELLDGIRLPMLFHLLAGPAIINPEFIDRVDFYPGNFPVQYGGYTGGIVDGITKRGSTDPRTEVDVGLTEAGGLIRRTYEPLGITATFAGRYGYPGLLLSLLSSSVSLSYWDYQARLDGSAFGGNWTIFAYGARDDLQGATTDPTGKTTMQTLMMFQTHHLDLRWQTGNEDRARSMRLVLLDDESQTPAYSDSRTLGLLPQLRLKQRLAPSLVLDLGYDGSITGINTTRSAVEQQALATLTNALEDSGTLLGSGVFVQLAWRPIKSLAIIPGIREDVLHDATNTRWSTDPRLMLRWTVSDQDVGGTTLKAGTGWFHQPPRIGLPLPGADEAKLTFPLLASEQSSLGADVKLGPGVDIDVETYYNASNPVLFDLSVNQDVSSLLNNPPTVGPGMAPMIPTDPNNRGQTAVEKLLTSTQGRAYGLELMLRKRDTNGFFGWIAYTLSRSERVMNGSWTLFDFDRTHILNAVGGIRLPRNWELGARMLFQTGTPVTTFHGYNTGRTDPQLRFDVRVDKRAVWNNWMLDFYVDVINATVAEDSGGLIGANSFRYVLPTIGFRAVL